MLAVTFADLVFRFRQFLIAIVGVTLALALALLLSGLASGFSTEISQTVGGFGADSWVMANAAGGRITAFAAFPELETLAVAGQPGVRDASPLLIIPSQVAHDGGQQLTVNLVGVVAGKLGDPTVTTGRGLSGPNQAVVNDRLGVPIGSTLVMGGQRLRVVGSVTDRTLLGGGSMVYVPLVSAQAIVLHGQPLITAVIARGTPATLPAGFSHFTSAQVTATTLVQMQSAVASIENTRLLMWVLAAVIVGALLYVAALERQQDFAVLKALGASSASLFGSLILEAIIVALIGTALAELVANALTPFLFKQPVDIRLGAYATLPIIAIVVGAVASLTALRRVVSADPSGGLRMTAHLGINELTVEFESSGYMVRPLDGLSFNATDGELVVLLGPSGCGKTTLISCMAALLTPQFGRVVFSGQTVNELKGAELALYRQQTVGVVFQAFNLIPSLTARANVMVPLRLAGVSRAQARLRADALLDRVGLAERAHHRPSQLSGGQQQRVAIARALVQNPPLVVADEPTAHLDHIQVEGVLQLLRELAAPGRIVVVATHDDRVTHIADRVVELVPNFANADRPPEELTLGPGDLLFEQGARGDLIYFVDQGRLEVFRVRADSTEEHLAEVGAGNYVGELGPILNLPRSASVRAMEATTVTGYTVLAFRRTFPEAIPGR